MKFGKTEKIILIIAALGFALWFGGNVMRTAVAFDVFEPGGELIVKDIAPELLMKSVYIFTMLSGYTAGGFAALFLGSLVLLFRWKGQLKPRGWIIMVFVMIFLTLPIEIFIAYMDIQLAVKIFWEHVNDFYHPAIKDYFLERFQNSMISMLSGIELLFGITMVIFTVWRPLDKTKPEK